MRENSNFENSIPEIKVYTLSSEKKIRSFINKLLDEIIANIDCYPDSYIFLLMKTKKGPLSSETVSIGAAEFDFEKEKNVDDALLAGFDFVNTFRRMGFPVCFCTSAEILEEFIGPLGVLFYKPIGVQLNFTTYFQTLFDLDYLFLSFDFIVDHDNRDTHSFDMSKKRTMPQWLADFSKGIYCYCILAA